MGWGIALAIAVPVILILLVVRRRRIRTGEALQLIGQVPSGPTLPGLEYLYPGRSASKDPDVRETAVTSIDRRPPAALPPGLKSTDDEA